jgi:hypothetical protein
MATAVDMADSITGMVTKPVSEYRHEQRRHKRERKREAATAGQDTQHVDFTPKREETEDDGRSSLTGSLASSADDSSRRKQHSMAGTVAKASAKSVGMLAPTAAKGMLVDIPLAITEGLRAVPQHLGTRTRDHGRVRVTNAKSGAVVAGKTFAWGFVDGLGDLVMEPVRGASSEGALGAVKGVGKGAVSLVAKSGAGMFGLLAYPSAGIAKSLRSAVRSGTRKALAKAKHDEGQWLLRSGFAFGSYGGGAGERFREATEC